MTQSSEFKTVFLPATPGWSAVYIGGDGLAVYKAIAFWSIPLQGSPIAWVGSIGGVVPAPTYGQFLGIKGPEEDINHWNRSALDTFKALRRPINLVEALDPGTNPNKRLRYKGMVSGVTDTGAIQILPVGGGPVQEETTCSSSEFQSGQEVAVYETDSGTLVELSSE